MANVEKAEVPLLCLHLLHLWTPRHPSGVLQNKSFAHFVSHYFQQGNTDIGKVTRGSHEGVGCFLQPNLNFLGLFHRNNEIADALLNNDHLCGRPLRAFHMGLGHQGDRAILNHRSASSSSYRVETWGDGMTFASALLHNIQVHLRLNMAVQMVHTFKLYSTQFTFIWGFSSVDTLMISQVVARTELFIAEVAGVTPCFMLTPHMST